MTTLAEELPKQINRIREIQEQFKSLRSMPNVMVEPQIAMMEASIQAGIKAALARGHRGGRKPKVDAKMLRGIKSMLKDPTVTHDEIASGMAWEVLNVSGSSPNDTKGKTDARQH